MGKKSLKGRRVGVLMGGLSSEREVSLVTGNAVYETLKEADYDVVAIDVDRDAAKSIADSEIDMAFIALHGEYGEDGAIQGILEYQGIPYTGSKVMASAMALDKCVSKEIFEYHRIPTPAFEIISRKWLFEGEKTLAMEPPVVVKPARGGSTIGITIVRSAEEVEPALREALKWGEEALVERFVEGTLLTVGVLGEEVLPVLEIAPKKGFYDYEAKYTKGQTEYFLPARIDPGVAKECQNFALEAHKALRCEGGTRTDFILDPGGTPYLLEINTIPGMTPTSLLPMAAKAAGYSFLRMVERMLELAWEKENLWSKSEA